MLEEHRKPKPAGEELFHSIISNLQTCLRPGRLLDVGCAAGRFMKYAGARGWQVMGFERSEVGARYSGLKMVTAFRLGETGLPESYYDACVLINVAENLPDPEDTFREVFRLLKPGGVVYITTPNWAGFRCLLRREDWRTRSLPCFTALTLERMAASLGFVDFLDLSDPADLTAEISEARASRTLQLSEQELKTLRDRIAKEDANRLSNGRGEILCCWARKPRSRFDAITADCRETESLALLEGRLVTGPGTTPEDQRVFLVRGRRKYWVHRWSG
jgi:SAM-dependent methyltransferase